MNRSRIIGEKSGLFLLLFIILLGSALRFYELGDKSLWVNELYAYFEAKKPFFEMLKGLDFRQPPPFFIFLNPYVKAVGPNDFLLRLPSALTGIISIGLIYILGKSLFSKREGLIGAFYLALSPDHINVSQDMRQYSLLVLFSLLSSIFFLKMLDRPIRKYFFLYVIVSLLMIYTQYIGIAVVLCHMLFYLVISFSARLTSGKAVISIRNRKMFKHIFIKAWLPLFALIIPGIVLIKMAPDQASSSIPPYQCPPPTLRAFASFANEMTTGYNYWGVGVRVFYLQIALVILGIVGLFKRYKRGIIFLCAMYVGLYYLIFAFLYAINQYSARRYFFITIPICVLLFSGGISCLSDLLRRAFLRRQSLLRGIAPAILALCFSIILVDPVKYYYKSERQNISGLAEFLEKGTKKNDILIFRYDWIHKYIGYYYPKLFERNGRIAESLEELKEIVSSYRPHRILIVYLITWCTTEDEKLWLCENTLAVKIYHGTELPEAIYFIDGEL